MPIPLEPPGLAFPDLEPDHLKTQDNIEAALKVVTFREQHVLLQFWSPHVVGKHQLLTTIDQPYVLGVTDVGLCSYRRDSERNPLVVDKDEEEEEDCSSPVARVFKRGLPEWASDLNSYTREHFPQLECAIRCNLHGYLALPVFDSNTRLCVGVLELLTALKYMNYTYEVQEIHSALKTQNLTSPQGFDSPVLHVSNERRHKDFNKISGILKQMCDIHSLPLAQTWAVSQHATFVSHEKVIKKSCSSFDTRCVGKVCMSTAALPFYLKDQRMLPFKEACRVQHLDKSNGFVGKALSCCGSCFCGDITKLGEEEYPLVQNASMHRLTSCFAIFLHSVEANDDYVLEFFLPSDIKDSGQVQNLVQTLKQTIEMASGFLLGDSSCIQVVEPPIVVGKSSESIMGYVANKQSYPLDYFTLPDFNVVGPRKNNKMISYPSYASSQKMCDNINDAGEKTYRVKQDRKRKVDSLTMEAVEKHVGKPIGEAAMSLGVSRSTLKRFCREHGMPSWSLPMHSKKPVRSTESKFSQESWPKQNLQRPSNKQFGLSSAAFLMIKVKRWICSRHGFSGKWWSCDKQSPFVQLSEITAKPKHTSPKQTAANILDIKMVTVKATFKDDIIKFQIPASSSLLELKHEVARRIKLESEWIRLKYMDEDDDLILLPCDDDLHSLLESTANNGIRLIVQMADGYL